MSTVEELRARAARGDNTPQIDPNVVLPAKVKAAAERANAFYGQPAAPAAPEPAPPQVPTIAEIAALAPHPAPQPAPPQAPPPVQVTPAPAPAPVEPPAPVSEEQWEHRYHSMKGRFDQATSTIGQQGEQLRQMGTELVRVQQTIANMNRQPPPEPPKLVTDEDVRSYGPELVDLMQRAAKEAVTPELTTLRQQNNQLRQRVEQGTRQGVYQTLDQQLPTWRDVNTNPRFKQWLSLRDIYSGQVRQEMINRALQAADAPRVLAFFKGFLSEEQATGNVPAPQTAAATPPAPARQAAVALETLTAPGRANPATGNTGVPQEKPVYTRAQVKWFYEAVRKGAYVGREQQKEIDENLLIQASKEGRVR